MLNKILSALVALFYIVESFVQKGPEASARALIFTILPLACIWFGDEMGAYIGQSGSGYITDTSPGFLVRLMGWLLLLLPLFVGLYLVLVGAKS